MAGYQLPHGQGDDLDLWYLQRQSPQQQQGGRRVEFAGPFGDTSQPPPLPVPVQQQHQQLHQQPDSGEKNYKIIGAISGITNLFVENILSHPFLVLRRQCQVNRRSLSYHTTPFTIIRLAILLERKQGLGCMWKGVGSVLLTKGMLIATESVIAETTSLPRITLDSIAKHLALKGIAIAIMTPFFCSSCVETVQSVIASENPGVFDCIKEGLCRSTHWQLSGATRLLPIWLLCGSTVFYHLSHYVISSIVRSTTSFICKQKTQKDTESAKIQEESHFNEIFSAFWGDLTADLILYPMETILNRLYLQGTRTIIDNVDHVSAVIPVISDYDGPFDCYSSIINEEGASGLYKGAGAIVVQYALHFAILKLTKIILLKVIPALEFKL